MALLRRKGVTDGLNTREGGPDKPHKWRNLHALLFDISGIGLEFHQM